MIFPLPIGVPLWERPLYALGRILHPSAPRRGPVGRLLQSVGDFLYDTAGLPYSRDLAMLHEALIRRGMASWVGEEQRRPSERVEDELSLATARVRRLLPTA